MKKTTGLLILTLIISCVSLFIPGSSAAAASESKPKVLATIDKTKITQTDFDNYLDMFDTKSSYRPTTPAARTKLLNHLIDRMLLIEEARKSGYFEDDELKKHSSLNRTEHETMVLRKLLIDRISRPATVADPTVNIYLETHPDLTFKQAQEKLIGKRQHQLYKKLMQKLRKGRKITIY
jgi:hypothetical protein